MAWKRVSVEQLLSCEIQEILDPDQNSMRINVGMWE